MAPLPIKPTVTRLLGGSALSAPSARPGMMSGIPRNAAAAAVRPRKLRRVMVELREDWERGFFMKYSFLPKAYTPEVDQGSAKKPATPICRARRVKLSFGELELTRKETRYGDRRFASGTFLDLWSSARNLRPRRCLIYL